jgi:hypothetical protein
MNSVITDPGASPGTTTHAPDVLGPNWVQGKHGLLEPTQLGLVQATNAEYQASDGVSKSWLDDIAPECGNMPLHFWAKRIDPNRVVVPKTPALILGDAIHTAILEPDTVSQRLIASPADAPRRPSITQINAKNPSADTVSSIRFWKDFDAEHRGKTCLGPEDMATVIRCRDRIHTHPVAKGLFQRGNVEQTFYAIDPETGALVKCRTDYERIADAGMLVDLKSTEDAGENPFGGSATKYRYDVQGVWYPDVIHAAYGPGLVQRFVFVAIEKEWPHAVGIYFLEREDEPAARFLARRDLQTILDCRAAEAANDDFAWPDHGAVPRPLAIRRAARRQSRTYTQYGD